MSATFVNGTPVPGATALQVAAAMVADPQWGFATDPNRAFTHALTNAEEAHRIREGWVRDRAAARLWTHVAVLLVAAAEDPYLATGQLPELVAVYGSAPGSA